MFEAAPELLYGAILLFQLRVQSEEKKEINLLFHEGEGQGMAELIKVIKQAVRELERTHFCK